MQQNDNGEVQLKAEAVIAAYKARLAEVEEQAIMLQAMLSQLREEHAQSEE